MITKKQKIKKISFRITDDLYKFIQTEFIKKYKSITQVLIDMIVEKKNESIQNNKFNK